MPQNNKIKIPLGTPNIGMGHNGIQPKPCTFNIKLWRKVSSTGRLLSYYNHNQLYLFFEDESSLQLDELRVNWWRGIRLVVSLQIVTSLLIFLIDTMHKYGGELDVVHSMFPYNNGSVI